MREIKFRAWRPENKVMETAYKFGCRCDMQNALDRKGVYEEFIVMQFTGLKDKNGKEIYEGDVLSEWGGDVGVIEWSQICCGFILATDDANNGIYNPEKSVVMGNIYENPDLLK